MSRNEDINFHLYVTFSLLLSAFSSYVYNAYALYLKRIYKFLSYLLIFYYIICIFISTNIFLNYYRVYTIEKYLERTDIFREFCSILKN